MNRIACALVASGLLIATNAIAQQEIYTAPVLSQEVLKTPITKASAALRTLAVTTTDKTVKILDIGSLHERTTLQGVTNTPQFLALTASGQSVVAACIDGEVTAWHTPTGVLVRNLTQESGQFTALAVQNENIVYLATDDKKLKVYDLISGKKLETLSSSPDEVTAIGLHFNNIEFALGMSSGLVNIYAPENFAILRTLRENKSRITTISFTPNGRYLIAGTVDGSLNIWETQNWTLKQVIPHGKGWITSVAFDPLVRWIAASSADSVLKIYDLLSFGQVKSLTETAGYYTFLSFVGSDTLLATTSRGFVKKWRVLPTAPDTLPPKITILHPTSTTRESAVKTLATEYEVQGIAYDDVEVSAVAVNSSTGKLSALSGTEASRIPPGMKGKKFTAMVKLDNTGVNTLEVRASDKAGHIAKESAFVNRLTIDQSVEILAPVNNTLLNTVSTPIEFKAWFNVQSYAIAVNLVDIPTNAVPAGNSAGDVIKDEIPLVVGENQIQLTVLGTQGERFSKSFSVSRKTEAAVTLNPPSGGQKKQRGPGPQAWAVVVGLSDYANKAIPALKYADKDAESFANFLRKPEGGGYDNDHMRVLLNKDATLANIKDALINFLGQAIDIDLVIVYFAGHGAPEPARPQNLYLLTYDSDPNMLGTTAFPMWQIQDVMGRYFNAKRVVVFTDACHSGGISADFATRGMGVTENNLINQYLTDLSKTKEGIVVFTASAAGEVSQEFPELGHGVFTYYMLEGLEGKADFNNDYVITINELMQYVEEQVKRKTKGAQNPTRSQTSYDKEMTIATIPH